MGALTNYSKFYYGPELTDVNQTFTIQEGGVGKVAFLNPGCYLPSEFPNALASAINTVTEQVYTVTFDRVTKLITISAALPFEIPLETMLEQPSSIAEIIGFTQGVDLSGANSYTGQLPCCKEYDFQFPLQSYMSSSVNASQIQGVKKRTITGVVEAVTFGVEKKVSFEAMYITDIIQLPGSVVRTKENSVAEFCQFLDFCIRQESIEFMENESNPEIFQVLTIASTESDPNGLGYRLIEEYDQGLPNYFRSGTLTFDLRGT